MLISILFFLFLSMRILFFFFFSSRRRHTRCSRDWSSDVCSSDLAKNVREDCDIDFMLLTDAGAMWRTRSLAMTSALFNRKFGSKKFCPNVFVSVAALTIERKSLYDAQELTQMIPLFGRDVYADLRKANPWTDRYLPNAQGAAEEDHFIDPPLPRLKNLVEWGSNSMIGRML